MGVAFVAAVGGWWLGRAQQTAPGEPRAMEPPIVTASGEPRRRQAHHDDAPLKERVVRAAGGAPPEAVARLLGWALRENSGIHMHPNFAIVLQAEAGAETPYMWAAVAFDSTAQEPPALEDTLTSVKEAAVQRSARDAAGGGSRKVVIQRGERILRMAADQCISAPTEDDLEDELYRLMYDPKRAAEAQRFPHIEVLKRTHYTVVNLLRRSVAERCLGPEMLKWYNYIEQTSQDGDRPLGPHAWAVTSRGFQRSQALDGKNTAAVVPIADFVNHCRSHPGAVFRWDIGGKFGYMEALRDILDGDEVTWAYHTAMPLDSVKSYGFFNASDFAQLPLGLSTKWDTEELRKAGCQDQMNPIVFEASSGVLPEKTLRCVELFLADPPRHRAIFGRGLSAGAASALRQYAVSQIAQLTVSRLPDFPERFPSVAEVPRAWVRPSKSHTSFVPTLRWEECLDAKDPPRPGYDVRRDVLQAVFAAEAYTRAALSKAILWLATPQASAVSPSEPQPHDDDDDIAVGDD